MRSPSRSVSRLPIVALAACLALAACGGGGGSSIAPGGSGSGGGAAPIWVAAWADAPSNATPSANDVAGSEQTFRTIVKPSVGSRGTVRVNFSNAFGTSPLALGAAHVGVHGTGASVVAETDVPLTFGGKPSVTIAAGGTAVSDPVTMQFAYGVTLAVTEYVSGSWPGLTQLFRGGLVTSYATPSGAGNATADVAGTAFTQKTFETFLVNRVDVLGNYTKTVAVVGSSTTIGAGSDLDQFDDLVSDVAADLHAAGRDDVAVVNTAQAPSGLLTINALAGNPAIVDRFGRDVLTLPGLATVILNAGDVDLKAANCSSAATIIPGVQNVIAQAHAAHVRIILAQVAPTTFCNGQNPGGFGTRFPAGTGQDAERQALNAWMASTQPSVVDGVTVQPPGADGVVDLSTPVADPANVAYLLPKYDIGDDSHLTAAGQALQAAAIPLGTL